MIDSPRCGGIISQHLVNVKGPDMNSRFYASQNRRFLLVCFLLLLVGSSHAQIIRTYGVKCGVVAATQDWEYGGDFTLDTGARWGLNAGGFVEFLDHPWLSFSLEARYVQKGFSENFIMTSESGPEESGTLTLTPRVDYLVFPLMAKFRLPLDGFAPYLIAGPTVNLLLGYEGDEFEPVYKDLEKTEIGGSVGLGCEIPAWGKTLILAEARYSPSFTDAFSNQALTVKNSAFEILVGIAF